MYEQHWQSKKLTKKIWAKNDPSPPYRATVFFDLEQILLHCEEEAEKFIFDMQALR